MAICVHIPTPLRRFTAGQDRVAVEGTTVTELLRNLEATHPGIRDRLYDGSGELRHFVSIFANDTDIRLLDGPETALHDGDEVSILPALALAARR